MFGESFCNGGACVSMPKCSKDGDCIAGFCCPRGQCMPCKHKKKCMKDADCRHNHCCCQQECQPCDPDICADDGCSVDIECGPGSCCIHEQKFPSWVPRGKTGKCGPCPFVPCQTDKRCSKDSDCHRRGECCNYGLCEGDIMMGTCGPCKNVCAKNEDCMYERCCILLHPGVKKYCVQCPDECAKNQDCGFGRCCIVPQPGARVEARYCGECPGPPTTPGGTGGPILNFFLNILNFILSLFIN